MLKKIFQKARSNQRGIGGDGENCAAKYLRQKRYKILAKNWYNQRGKRLGEIDIVVQHPDGDIRFVEVKTRHVKSRQSLEDLKPEEQITRAKLHKLQRVAEKYITEKKLWSASWDFDAVSVVFVEGEQEPHITHLENIFY